MCIVLPARTTFALEREAIAIIGQDCSQWHDAMVEALEQLDGIARVQADVIPNHPWSTMTALSARRKN
jgi:hypothetical protein